MDQLRVQDLIKDCYRCDGRISPTFMRKTCIESLSSILFDEMVEKTLDVSRNTLKLHYIFVHSKYVLSNQIKLRVFNSDEEEEEDYQYIIFIIFNVDKEFYTSNAVINDKESFEKTIRLNKLYILKRDQFKQIELFKTHFKSIHLDHCTPLSSSSSHPIENDIDIIIKKKKKKTTTTTTTTTPAVYIEGYKPFSLANHLMNQEEEDTTFGMQTSDDFIDYMNLVCDCALLKSLPSSSNIVTTRNKLIDYYNRQRSYKTRPIVHGRLFIDFLSQLIRFTMKYLDPFTTSSQSVLFSDNITYLSIETLQDVLPLTKEMIDAEVFQFAHGDMSDTFIDSFHNVIHTHIKRFLSDVSHVVFHPPWFDYCFEGGVIWKREGKGGDLFKIRYEWTLLIEKHKKGIKIIKGFAYIDSEMMKQVLLPLIYRTLLQDVVLYTFYMNRHCKHELAYNKLYMNSSQWFIPDIILPLLDSNLLRSSRSSSNDALFQFSLQYGNHSSPVIRKWMKTVEMKAPIGVNNNMSSSSMYARFPRDLQPLPTLPDIEDIISSSKKKCCGTTSLLKQMRNKDDSDDILPPCMRKVMDLPHLKHMDRLNMVKYYYSMGYSEDEVIRILDGKVDAIQVKILYKSSCQQKYESNEFSIMKCGSIINLKNPMGNVLRCHYEEKESPVGVVLTRYTYDEKLNFIHQCFKSSNDGLSYKTPVDYIMQKMNKPL